MSAFELTPHHRDIPDAFLLEDLREVAAHLGRSPTASEYNELGKYHSSTLARRFGKWSNAISQAGLFATRSMINIPNDDLLKNIETTWIRLGRQPTYADMNSPDSKVSAKTYENRFGSWRAALAAFVVSTSIEPERNAVSAGTENPKSVDRGARSRHINQRLRMKVFDRDHYSCVACGRSPAKDLNVELHIDHKVPWSKGGESNLQNLQTLCSVCNIGKSNVL
jgi:5-methylcytosine-specific restriction endonuclease McrA